MRCQLALIASVLIAVPALAQPQTPSPDLSAYNCARVGDGASALTGRHVLQYIEGQFYEWDEYLTREDTPRIVCLQRTRPTAQELTAAAAQDFLIAGARIGAPSAPGNVERSQGAAPTSPDGKFHDAAPMPLPKALAPRGDTERSQGFDPDAMSPASRRYDTAPRADAAAPATGGASSAAPVERQQTVGVDDRTRVSTSLSPTYPYNTVGYLSVTYPSGDRFRCSGVLVSPYVVITAGHCVHDNDEGGFITSATFYPAQNETSFIAPTTRPNGGKSDLKWVRTTNRWTQISGPDSHVTSDYQYDLAALEFATPFTYTSTFMPIAFNLTNSQAIDIGYPASVGGGTSEGMWLASGSETSRSVSSLRAMGEKEYAMDATGGQSGSPFLTNDTAPRLQGILSYGDDLDDKAGGPWYSTNNQSLVAGWASWTPASDSGGTATSSNSVSGLRVSGIYDSSNTATLSFLRFYNTGVSASTVDVTLANPDDGTLMATWTSPSIPANAALQVDIGTVERGATGGAVVKRGYFTVSIRPHFNGYFQHVLWRPREGNLSNATMCDTKLTNDPTRLMNVHTSTLSAGYPATIIIQNTGSTTANAVLGVYDSVTGTKLGSYSTGSIAPNAEVIRSVDQIEAGISYRPAADQFHYNIRMESSFTGTMQYRMTNTVATDTLDMTAVCTLVAQ